MLRTAKLQQKMADFVV